MHKHKKHFHILDKQCSALIFYAAFQDARSTILYGIYQNRISSAYDAVFVALPLHTAYRNVSRKQFFSVLLTDFFDNMILWYLRIIEVVLLLVICHALHTKMRNLLFLFCIHIYCLLMETAAELNRQPYIKFISPVHSHVFAQYCNHIRRL